MYKTLLGCTSRNFSLVFQNAVFVVFVVYHMNGPFKFKYSNITTMIIKRPYSGEM